MNITHENREYIIVDGENRYSVNHNINHNRFEILKIEPDEMLGDRNSVSYFDVPDELRNRIIETIENSKQGPKIQITGIELESHNLQYNLLVHGKPMLHVKFLVNNAVFCNIDLFEDFPSSKEDQKSLERRLRYLIK